MATLAQNATDIAACATAIDNAIVAKGGSLVGGGKLRNAAAGISAIPTGPAPETHWWDDFDATIFEVLITDNDLSITDYGKFPDGTKIWWDANNDGASGYITKASAAEATYTYASAGKKILIVKDSGANWQSKFNMTSPLPVRFTKIIRFQSNVKNIYAWFDGLLYGCEVMIRNFTGFNTLYASFNYARFSENAELTFSNSSTNRIGTIFAKGVLTINGVVSFYALGPEKLIMPNNYGFSLQGSDGIRTAYAPSETTIKGNKFYGVTSIKNVTLGTISEATSTTAFYQSGMNNVADSEGIKLRVTVGNTCASLLAFSAFPFGAGTYTKFICADGYIAYDTATSSWIAHTEA